MKYVFTVLVLALLVYCILPKESAGATKLLPQKELKVDMKWTESTKKLHKTLVKE